MTEYFKDMGEIDHIKLLAQLSPRIEYMIENNLLQYGLLGKQNKDGTYEYGEGKDVIGNFKYETWDHWRHEEDNSGPLAELFARLHQYKICRTRIMRANSKACYSWHRDSGPRIHVPLVTSPHAFLVVKEESRHLTAGKVWWVDTRYSHTAMNCGEVDRYHLVLEIYE